MAVSEQGLLQHQESSKDARTWKELIEEFFDIHDRGSSIRTEIRAGLVLFATGCYVLVVNPDVLSLAGMNTGQVATGTALCGFVVTMLMGLWANLPFLVAPGMGVNTMFACEIINQKKFTEGEALACSFMAGLMMTLLSLSGFCTEAVNRVPLSLKKAVICGIGLFQTLVGLHGLGIVQPGRFGVLLEFHGIDSLEKLIGVATLLCMAMLILFEIPGSILIGILLGMSASLYGGIFTLPSHPLKVPCDLRVGFWNLDFEVFHRTAHAALVVFTLFAVLFVDTGGVMIGIAAQGRTLMTSKGDVVHANRCWTILSAGVMLSALCGTSPLVIFLESAAAVCQGGRTGLTAVVGGSLFGLAMFFVPVIKAVPSCATMPILILVGSFMMSSVLAVPWDKINHSFPAYTTITMIAFTCSISDGVLCGFTSFAILNLPFLVAKVFGRQWLGERLSLLDENESVFQMRLAYEQEVDKQSAILSLTQQGEALIGDGPSNTWL